MGDKASDTSLTDLYRKLIPANRLNDEANPPHPGASASGESSIGGTNHPYQPNNVNGERTNSGTSNPYQPKPYQPTSANQENPNAVLNNPRPIYAGQQNDMATDDNQTALGNQPIGLSSPGAPAYYSQNAGYNYWLINKYDPNVPPRTPIGINLGRVQDAPPVVTYKQMTRANTVHNPDPHTNAEAAAAAAAGPGLFVPGGGGAKLAGVGGNMVRGAVVSEVVSLGEDKAAQVKPFDFFGVKIDPHRAFHRGPWETGAEAFLATIGEKWKYGVPLAVLTYFGCRSADYLGWTTPAPGTQPVEKQHKAEGNLNTDYAHRSGESMRNAINTYASVGIFKYTSSGDPTNKVHTESREDNLVHLASVEGWNSNQYDGHRLYANELEKLRGSVITKTAFADVAMHFGTMLRQQDLSDAGGEKKDREAPQYILQPNRNRARPNDYLDFGGEALSSLANAQKDLDKLIAISRQQIGEKPDNSTKPIDQAEIDGLLEIQKEINRRVVRIQCGQRDPNNPNTFIGHDLVSAFKELSGKNALNSNIVAAISGKNESLFTWMEDQSMKRKDSKNSWDRIVTSKQYRDLALWTLANLSPNGTSRPEALSGPASEDKQVVLYRDALRAFLYPAEKICPDTPNDPNPDLENLRYIAQVLAGKLQAKSQDWELQQTANNLNPKVQEQMRIVYDGYEDLRHGRIPPGSFHPYQNGDVRQDSVPNRDRHQWQMTQSNQDKAEQAARDAANAQAQAAAKTLNAQMNQ